MTATHANARIGLFAGLLALSMLGAAYAAVPLYRLFCQVTGWDGTPMRGAAAPGAVAGGQAVTVRFDSNTAPGMAWQFKPAQQTQVIRVGEKAIAFYKAHNPAGEATSGTAVFNVSPDTVGKYFTKIECFCFTEQTLGPGESADMPVLYYIDPAYLDDPDAAKVEEITLSYTFFPKVTEPVKTAADRRAMRDTQG